VTIDPDGAAQPNPPQPRVEVLGNVGPNWFASVMGTGIVAVAGATLPVQVPGLRGFAEVVWLIAAVLLAVLVVAIGGHWLE
jgi:tellurite resistance protein TehA-like permease